MLRGTFYGLGVGPGESGLLTTKAAQILGRTDILCVPSRAAGLESRALSAAEPYLKAGAPVVELLFPMSKENSVLEAHWLAAAEKVAELLVKYDAVTFVTIGDPLTYSTFSYLLATLRRLHPAVNVEIVPGVTSFHAAAALLQIPLIEGEERLAVVSAPVTAEELAELVRYFATIVILKVSAAFDHTLDLLREQGITQDVYLVSHCGGREEFYTKNPFELYGQPVDYLSLLIVKRRA